MARTRSGGRRKGRSRSSRSPTASLAAWWDLRHVRAVRYLLALGACGYAVISLASYDPVDPGWSRRASAEEVHNLGGRWGAVLADLLLQLFGYGAWMVVLLAAWLGLRLARRPAGRTRSWGVLVGLTLWLDVVLDRLVVDRLAGPFRPGGWLGSVMADALVTRVGSGGTWVVLFVVGLALLTVLAEVDWERLADRLIAWLGRRMPAAAAGVRAACAAAGARLGAGCRAALRGLASWVLAALAGALRRGREALSGEGRRRSESPSRAVELGAPEPEFPSLLLPPEPALPAADARPPTAALPTDIDRDLRPPPERDAPTLPAGRDLVEVQEVPTTVGTQGEPGTAGDPGAPILPATPALPGPSPREEGGEAEAPGAAGPGEEGGEAEAPGAAGPGEEGGEAEAPGAAGPGEEGPSIRPGDLRAGGAGRGARIVRPEPSGGAFELPSTALLDAHELDCASYDEAELRQLAAVLEQKLEDFGIRGQVTAIRPGPVITIFEYLPAPGVRLARILSLSDDIAMAMRALRVRIVAPIPGRGVVGIELPNRRRQMVWLRDVLSSDAFRKRRHTLPMALGRTVEGRPRVVDLAQMPHLLIGGTTGSGKSVGINSMLVSLLFARTPEELRLVLIDPKMLEFELYQDIPHLLHPVVVEPRLASAVLKWAVTEMDARYARLARWGTRNIASYNRKVEREASDWNEEKARRYAPRGWPEGEPLPGPEKLPYIVIVIDELADLMMVAAKEVEASIVRLAQKARACGIHLVVATQRPSVDVITGLIKANMPARIAFQVRSRTDGRTILDQNGAETLLGKGDMLYLPPGVSALERLHGPFVSDDEVQRVADHLRAQGSPSYDLEIRDEDASFEGGEEDVDEYYDLALQIVTEAGKASTSMIQRRLKIGYNRAARIIEMMEREGVVGPADGARPREVLVGRV